MLVRGQAIAIGMAFCEGLSEMDAFLSNLVVHWATKHGKLVANEQYQVA